MTGAVLVVAGGPTVAPALDLAVEDRMVIAADSGADRALAHGWPVHHVVGDLDSITPDGLAACREQGAQVHTHPPDKDATDLELALDLALEHGATDVHVVLDGGGRLDHQLAAALVLASHRYTSMSVVATAGTSRLTVVRGRRQVTGAAGDLVTLLALGGPARVRTEGLRFPLTDEWLAPSSGRGVSNELLGAEATVTVTEGVVLAVQP